MYRIGAVSATTCSSARSLRHYEARGLVSPARDARGRRIYSEDDIARIRRIRRFLEAGFTLEQIATLLRCGKPDSPTFCAAIHSIVVDVLANLDAAHDSIQRRRHRIVTLFPEIAPPGEPRSAGAPP